MATALFLAWIDPSGVGCPWAIGKAPFRKHRATTDRRRMAHLSADRFALPTFRTDDNEVKVKGKTGSYPPNDEIRRLLT
jgi:hypothetical protein